MAPSQSQPPHSATVRGTLSHPNFSTNNIAPPLGDPVSLEREKVDGKTGSAPSTKALDPYDGKGEEEGGMAGVPGRREKKKENRSMLGDAVSLEKERVGRRGKGGSKL